MTQAVKNLAQTIQQLAMEGLGIDALKARQWTNIYVQLHHKAVPTLRDFGCGSLHSNAIQSQEKDMIVTISCD